MPEFWKLIRNFGCWLWWPLKSESDSRLTCIPLSNEITINRTDDQLALCATDSFLKVPGRLSALRSDTKLFLISGLESCILFWQFVNSRLREAFSLA
jgi:hypothetical protein